VCKNLIVSIPYQEIFISLSASSMTFYIPELHPVFSTLQFSTITTRSHPVTLCIPSSTINPCWYSFFVNTLFPRNTIPLRILQLQNAMISVCTLSFFLYKFTVLFHLLYFTVYVCVCIFVCFVHGGVLLQAMPSVYPHQFDKSDNLIYLVWCCRAI